MKKTISVFLAATLLFASVNLFTATAAPANEKDKQGKPEKEQIETLAGCSDLAGKKIAASDIGLPTSGAVIQSATMEKDENGAYCKTIGAIHPVDKDAPDINFEVNLPEKWNRKALQLGGGGFNGSVITGLGGAPSQIASDPKPLALGYVTFGSDSGHKGPNNDASFALNEEALANFAGDQLKKTHDAAMVLVKESYGVLPDQMYFAGSSEGGREALTVIQRWPGDYDGVICFYPAYNLVGLQMNGVLFGQALYAGEGAGWLNPQKMQFLSKAVYQACDGLDGAEDGIISNVPECVKAYTIDNVKNDLRCPDGADAGNDCLSDAQINTVKVMSEPSEFPFMLSNGVTSFPQQSVLQGGDYSGRFNLGTKPIPSIPPAGDDAFLTVMGDQIVRNAIAKDPNLNFMDFKPENYAEQAMNASKLLDSNSVKIANFQGKGGKLILVVGTTDTAISPYNTINYYKRLQEQFKQSRLDQFVRFYTIPGFGHGDGPFKANLDTLTALDNWVVKGEAPGNLVAVDANQATEGRTRPVCVYPQYPKYTGGDMNKAESFACAAP